MGNSSLPHQAGFLARGSSKRKIPRSRKGESKLEPKDKEVKVVLKDYLWWKRFIFQPTKGEPRLHRKDKEVKAVIKDYYWWKRFIFNRTKK